MRRKRIVLFALIYAVFYGVLFVPPLWSLEKNENTDETILLDASVIRGKRLQGLQNPSPEEKKRPTDRPLLNTTLPWDGEAQDHLDIPNDVLDQLTRPDLSFLLERESEWDEADID